MNAPVSTTIVIDLWQLIGFLVMLLIAFFGCVWAFAAVLLRQIQKHLDERFNTHNGKLETIEKHGRNLERDLLTLRAELPTEYVRREDWIRFSGTIDAKLDYLRMHGEETRRAIVSVGEQVKSLIGRSA